MSALQPTAPQNATTRTARGRFAPGVLQPGARPFPKGKSGNAKGRPRASATVREYLNLYASYTLPALDAIVSDEGQTVAKRGAALAWLRVFRGQRAISDGGSMVPAELQRILDAIDGRRPPKLPRSKWVRDVLKSVGVRGKQPIVTRTTVSIGS